MGSLAHPLGSGLEGGQRFGGGTIWSPSGANEPMWEIGLLTLASLLSVWLSLELSEKDDSGFKREKVRDMQELVGRGSSKAR